MAVTKKQADEMRWTLGQETASTTSPISVKTDLTQRTYVATGFTVDENGEKAASDSLRAGFSDVFGELNGLWADGSITMELPEGEGLLPIMEAVLGDTNPVSIAEPHKQLFSAHNLTTALDSAFFTATTATAVNAVNAALLLNTVVVNAQTLSGTITIADNLSATRGAITLTVTPSAAPDTADAPIVINYTEGTASRSVTLSFTAATAQTFDLPANSTITSVTATNAATHWASSQTLTIIAPIVTIANNLSEFDDALALTVTPSADPTSAGAEIVINYDEDGASKSGTLSFDNATPQMFNLPANSTITSVTATDAATHWAAQTLTIAASIAANIVRNPNFERPGQLHFEFTTAPVPVPETIRVKGLRKVGISTKDWLLLEEDIDYGADVTSDKYFRTINSIEFLDVNGDPITLTAGVLTLTSEPTGYSTVVKVQDAILPNYTIEAEVAGVPRLITAAKFIGATINNEATLNAELQVLAERSDRRRTVESGFTEKFTTTMADNPTEFPEVSIGFFTGIGGYLEIDGNVVLFNSSPITIDAGGYESPNEKAGSIFRPEAERTGRRQVTCSVNARYEAGDSTSDVYTKWDQKYRDNAAVRARIVQYRWASDGRQKALIWDMPYCEITAPVRVEATAPGSVPIVVPLKATPDPTTTDTSEITLTIINDDQA